MSRERIRGVIVSSLVALLGAVGTAAEVHAQVVITGRVTTEAGAPIPNAGVSLRQFGVGTTTSDSGTFRLSIPSTGGQAQIVISVRRIGFAPQERAIAPTEGTHSENFTLKADPLRLDQMITTGVADSTSSRSLSFSVAHISAEQVSDVPASNPLEALAGKVAGAKIQLGVGNPGAAPAIRLRGSTSLNVGQSKPLIIIDGVMTTESIADFDALDIESVEVLKGAAGASFYGSNAANGVITITTKRGRGLSDNRMSVSARTEYGQSGIGHWPSVNHGTRMQFNADGSVMFDEDDQVVLNTSGFDDTPFPSSGPNRFRNQLQTWMQNNDYYNNDVSLGLRRGNTNFASTFSSSHNGGILPFKNGQFKQNVRLNVDQGLGSKADVSASITYGNQRNDYGEGSSQAWFALYQAPPYLDLEHPNPIDSTTLYYPVLPSYTSNARGNPLYDLSTNTSNIRRERILGSVAAHYRPLSWLRLDATYGTDRLNFRQRNYTPRGSLSSTSGAPGPGSVHDYSTNDVAWNSQTRATATKLFGDLLSTTSVAYQLESETDNSFDAGGSRLTVNAVPDLAALGQDAITVGSQYVEQRTTDYMASQSLTFKDRYIFDALYRRDGSSLFGPESRWSDFYRVSGAYRLTQDITIPGVQELRIHAARGTAGLRPEWFYQYETYSLAGGTFNKATLGNKELRPAVLTENEYGINAEFLDRFSAEVTYADRMTRNAFIRVPLSLAASGGFEAQWQNAASIESKTIEGAFQARVLDRGRFSWDIGLTGDHTTQSIVSMNRAPFRVSADNSQGQAVFWYEAGKPVGIIYGQKYVHSFAQLKENPANASAVESDYVVNPLGYLVRATARGTRAERPITYVDATGKQDFVIGDVNPDLNFGISNDFQFGAFNLHTNFDGQVGGDIYNFSKQWTFQDLRSGDMDMTGKTSDSEKIAEDFFSQGLYNGLNPSEYFVESGTYLKLREFSVGYKVSQRFLPKIGLGRAAGLKVALIGRNLLTWTNYSGFDPDVTSGGDFNFRIDGFKYPPFRTLTGQIEIQF